MFVKPVPAPIVEYDLRWEFESFNLESKRVSPVKSSIVVRIVAEAAAELPVAAKVHGVSIISPCVCGVQIEFCDAHKHTVTRHLGVQFHEQRPELSDNEIMPGSCSIVSAWQAVRIYRDAYLLPSDAIVHSVITHTHLQKQQCCQYEDAQTV